MTGDAKVRVQVTIFFKELCLEVRRGASEESDDLEA